MTVLGRRPDEERAAVRAAVERLQKALDEAREAARQLRACPWCGAVFIRHNRQDYCSHACSQATREKRRQMKVLALRRREDSA
jgi:uncharacterized C2H2 Zn-finger protein